MPDICFSVRRIERFSVFTGLIGIIGIVAIFFPHHTAAWDMDSSKTRANQPACTACLRVMGEEDGNDTAARTLRIGVNLGDVNVAGTSSLSNLRLTRQNS